MQTALMHEVETRGAEILGQKLLEFCHLLRAHRIEVAAGRIIDAFRALMAIDVFRRGDFYTVLEANFISHAGDRELFHQLFLEFWRGPIWAMIPDPCLPGWEDGCELPPPELQHHKLHVANWDYNSLQGNEEAPLAVALYSPEEVLTRKDFGKMTQQELLRVQRLLMTMARQMATSLSRRKQTKVRAHLVDPRRTMRRNLRYGGEVIDLVRRGPKLGKTKMVVLCDVSGSMDVYTRFLIQFLYGLQNGLRRVETIVFSTHLTRITPLLRRRDISSALDLVAQTVHNWSGGTKIGTCLQEFNHTLAARMVTSKTLVVIISDGWDTGDIDILDHAMSQLHSRAFRTIWLNPLLGSPNYQPICKGMHTALPYVDDFMSVHNVESLRQFGRLVENLL